MHTRTPSVDLVGLSELFSHLASGGKSPRPSLAITPPRIKSRTSSIGSIPELCSSPTSISSGVSLRTISDESDASSSDDDGSSDVPQSPLAARGRTPERVFNSGDKPKSATSPHADKDFTFKLMLHDIYGPEKFVTMVKDVIKESKKNYRPLPDHLKGKPRREFLKRRDLDTSDEDSPERVVRPRIPETPPKPRYPESLTLGTPPIRIARAAKKRCVGRTRSGREAQPREFRCHYEFEQVEDTDTSAWFADASFTVEPLELPSTPARKSTVATVRPRTTTNVAPASVAALGDIDVSTALTGIPTCQEGVL